MFSLSLSTVIRICNTANNFPTCRIERYVAGSRILEDTFQWVNVIKLGTEYTSLKSITWFGSF